MLNKYVNFSSSDEYRTALQDAARLGKLDVVMLLLKRRFDVKIHGTALQAAVEDGNVDVVKLLLDQGADVNVQGGEYGTALQAAARFGKLDVVKLLLKQGADVNVKGGELGTALQAAAYDGNVDVVKLLLDQGADVKIQGGEYGTALQAAARFGKLDVVKLLLKQGADVNVKGGELGTALQAAAYDGNVDVVKLLLDQGADVNVQGGEYGTALQAAARSGKLDVVKLLLKQGADVKIQGGEYGTPLQAAARSGKLDVVKLLLKQGADVNVLGGEYGTALQAAAYDGNLDVVKLLLDQGADINVQGGENGTALQVAAYNGKLDVVKLLLQQGADVNVKGGELRTALQAAARFGNVDVVKLLLDQGADVNIQGGEYGTALQAAAYDGNLDVVKLLLKQGADVKIQGGAFGTALQAAAYDGNVDVVKLLLDQGADVKTQGGEYGTALQAAAYDGNVDVVKLLLDQGSDVNVQGGEYGTALQAAAHDGDVNVVKLLLDQRADMNVQSGEYGTALQAAAYDGNVNVVKLLLDQGADVNVKGGKYGNALQAAARRGNLDIIRLLLNLGANVGIPTLDSQGASLLHSAVACEDRETLNLVLEAGAHFYIAKADAFNQTPLHIAASHYLEAFQILENSLNSAAKNEKVDAWALMHVAINEKDIDGCTPLHCAVENHALGAAEWLINHGANVDIEDFNKITPFQRASQLKDFRMMSHLFPYVTKGFIKATDWRACVPSRAERNIILALGGPEISPVQVKDDQELTQYFNAMSYSLAFSTSSVSAQGDKCVATAISQRAVVLLENDSLLDQSSSEGVSWRWWRKAMRKRKLEELRMEKDKLNVWHWKVQLNGIPSAVALRQPSRTECFLECRVSLPSYKLLPPSNQLSALKIERKNHAIIWLLVKSNQHHPGSTSGNLMLESKILFTILEYCEISNSPAELFCPCIQQLEDEWNDIFEAAEDHLINMRRETFRSNGRSTDLIKIHLSDAELWTDFKRVLMMQRETLRSLCDERSRQILQEDSTTKTSTEFITNFMREIENTDRKVKEKILSLNLASQELIQLEFNLTSIAEAQKSTSMNRSMKRLSWITFVFLPLMFIASLFGMNIDLLESNPPWWLYIPFAVGTTILTLSIWVLFKSKKGLEDTIEQRFNAIFRRKKLGDEEAVPHVNHRKGRTMQFAESGKKRS